jgi:predicted transglutaminase-like cysteine proteinase
VLIVVTNRGQLVLDNLTGRILPLSQSGLRLMSMSSADPLKWT